MTTSQYNLLLPYRKCFETAVKSNYATLSRDEFNTIVMIYYDNYPEQKLSKSAYNCAKCKLKELKKIGKEYFDFEMKYDIKK